MSQKPMTKEEQRDAAADPIFDEGRSWFEYIADEFVRRGGIVPDEAVDQHSFFLALGLLGRHADFDYDDVDYTLEGE